MSTEQDTAYKESWRTSSTENARRTIARDSHQYNWTTSKIKWQKNPIVVIIDRFTKMIRPKATITAVLSEEIAKIYWDKIWKIHEVPQKILSDRGPQFASWFMEDLTKALETKKMLSIAYYP